MALACSRALSPGWAWRRAKPHRARTAPVAHIVMGCVFVFMCTRHNDASLHILNAVVTDVICLSASLSGFVAFAAECRRFGVSIPHGATYRPSACAACQCSDGRLRCDRQRECPALDCPADQQVREEGKCCKVCRGGELVTMKYGTAVVFYDIHSRRSDSDGKIFNQDRSR